MADEKLNGGVGARTRLGIVVSVAIVLCGAVSALLVALNVTYYPRTDDAEVFANLIGMPPRVEGPVVKLYVRDNQYVKKGDMLYQLDARPYLYTLQRDQAELARLEGEVENESRRIATERSGVDVSQAGLENSVANLARSSAAVDEATAEVTHYKDLLQQRQADSTYATDNLHRLGPLLAKQYVTVDQVDRARTKAEAMEAAVSQARAQLASSRAMLATVLAQHDQAKAMLSQSQAALSQSKHSVLILQPTIAQRDAAAAAVRLAEYNYEYCSVRAPFDARVTNLIVSDGAYVHVGQQLFTLIDTTKWWILANFRETQLWRMRPGVPVYVYLMSQPGVRYRGVVESVAHGVTLDPDIVGRITQGLPDAQRTLNWVHLASRFPVRIRVLDPVPDTFRIGETAVAIIRHDPHQVSSR
ncbi:MAG: biotin/lipoyl-binding protein [Acidobacteriaceae bacterium]